MKNLILTGLIVASFQVMSQSPTTGKFELFGDHIFIKVVLDGSDPLDFILDTGDGLTVVDSDVAQALKLGMDHKSSATSALGSINGALIAHNTIELYGQVLSNVKVYATDLDHLEISIGRNIDGIIGYDLLKTHVVSLNYDNLTIDVYPSSFSGSEGNFGEGIHFKLIDYIPTISGYVSLNNGETLDGEYFVFTGAGTTMDFNTHFADSHNIVDKTGEHYSYLVKGLTDEENKHYEGKVKAFRFGTMEFKDMPIGISQATSGVQANKKVAGIIGNRLLRRFNVTFDFKHKMIYLKENSHFPEEFHVNASGIDLQLGKDKQKVLIHQVYENSPADKAGIRVDAELISVDGKEAKSLSLPQLQEMLNTSGKTVNVVVLQDGKELQTSLQLKDLI